MSDKIWVRCKQVPGLEGKSRLRVVGAAENYFTHEPQEVDAGNIEVLRRLRQGNLELVDAPGVMVDIPENPQMTTTEPGNGSED